MSNSNIRKTYTVKMSIQEHEAVTYIKNRLIEKDGQATLNDAFLKAILEYSNSLKSNEVK